LAAGILHSTRTLWKIQTTENRRGRPGKKTRAGGILFRRKGEFLSAARQKIMWQRPAIWVASGMACVPRFLLAR
jgi:hypothetical protein